MLIDKFTAFKVLAKHLIKKMGASAEQVDLNNLATSLSIMFVPQIPVFKKMGILVDENFNIDVIEDKVNQLFAIAPTLNFPFGPSSIQITKADVIALLEELKKFSVVEEVINLPYQK